jgi:hypothetical protein
LTRRGLGIVPHGRALSADEREATSARVYGKERDRRGAAPTADLVLRRPILRLPQCFGVQCNVRDSLVRHPGREGFAQQARGSSSSHAEQSDKPDRAEDDAGREDELAGPTVRQPGTKPVPPEAVPRPSIPTVRQRGTKPVPPIASPRPSIPTVRLPGTELVPPEASPRPKFVCPSPRRVVGRYAHRPFPRSIERSLPQSSLGSRSYQMILIRVRSPGGATSNPPS